jgi:alpha-D-xyloside xylohydrolase
MAEDLRGGLSFCSSGPAFWSHDIGGFEGTADAANYKRWVAFGLLSTHSRLHGSSSYRVPWLFDEESVVVMRQFARLKNRLFPYLFAQANDAADHGWPVMRTMFVEFPNEPACRYLDRQYMLGESLLVAPIFNEAGTCEHYVPKGTWVDILTNERVVGGTWRNTKHDFFHLPVLLREDSILAMSAKEESPSWTHNDDLTLHIGHLTAHADISARVVPGNSGDAVTFKLNRKGNVVTMTSDAANCRVWVLLRGRRKGEAFEWNDPSTPLTFTVGD